MKNSNQQIKLELTVDEINIILNAMGQMPYVKVAPVIAKISNQAESQWEKEEKKAN